MANILKVTPRRLKLSELGSSLKAGKLTREQVLSLGIGHILSMGHQSIQGHGQCAYMGKENSCCAAAPFISDYTPQMEGKGWGTLVEELGQSPEHESQIKWLQDIHDSTYMWQLEPTRRVSYIENKLLERFNFHGMLVLETPPPKQTELKI